MNRTQIKDNFLFNPFCHLFPYLLDPLSHGQCDQENTKKSVQKLNKINKSFNSRSIHQKEES